MTQEQSALVPSNYNELPKEAKRTNDSTTDRIWKYYHNNKTRVELTPEEEIIRERWEKAWFLLCKQKNQKQVVEKLEKLFSVKKSVAYDDVRNAMLLFGNPQDNMKDAKRSIAETMALRGADKCWKNGDMEGYHKFQKLYIDINGLTVQDNDRMKDLLKNLKATTLIFVTSPDKLKDQAAELMKDIPTVDTSFEEVNDED